MRPTSHPTPASNKERACEDLMGKRPTSQEAGPHQTPNLLAPEWREIYVLFRRHPVAGVFVFEQPKWTKTLGFILSVRGLLSKETDQ